MAKESGETPEALRTRPTLYEDLRPVVEAFGLLAAARPVVPGFGAATPAPIPLSEISAYIALFGVRDREEFVSLIRAADQAYLGACAEMSRAREAKEGGR